MLKSHEKFHSANGKRQILVVDDELINQELLKIVLESEYEIVTAFNGEEALELLNRYKDTLSLMLLDLMMPGMSGIDVLKRIRDDVDIRQIPVIVTTADQAAEIECLTLGAIDFIPKPYPREGVIKARVLRTIELSEDRQIIMSTERDPLTGLYNREYFYSYAEQFDQHHRDLEMDAIVLDVNHFHMINERYGRNYGDAVLRRIGEKVREMVRDTGGIVCRREADTFLVYCPHGKDYNAILENASVGLAGEGMEGSTRVRLRMGVYSRVDKEIGIEHRFDKAKLAADTIKNNFSKAIAEYDHSLYEEELFDEQLVENFHDAIREKQFRVLYQPKFNIKGEKPVLSSAEALVRWNHPRLGPISPGVFIPVFEENGMITELDKYVWRMAAGQIKDWKERFGITVPVSVNVSRVDIYDAGLVETFRSIVSEFGLEEKECLLEITESAYTADEELIILTVKELRELGFRIEMDDFGTGYSSLGMISRLPIDALKLDMTFVRNAFNEKKDVRMLELIMGIAEHLNVPVIAEGVETRDQMLALKTMGCDVVQGYYFSRPVEPGDIERYILEKKELSASRDDVLVKSEREKAKAGKASLSNISSAMAGTFDSLYYVDMNSGYYLEFDREGLHEELSLNSGGEDFFRDLKKRILQVVYKEDIEKAAVLFDKDLLESRLARQDSVNLTIRYLTGGKPEFCRIQAVKAGRNDTSHVVMGIEAIDEGLRDSVDEVHAQHRSMDIYGLAEALSGNYETIYYVDKKTGAYTVFGNAMARSDIQIETNGVDFYEDCRHDLMEMVYPEDQPVVAESLMKDRVLAALEEKEGFTLDYRLMIDGDPVSYRMTCFLPGSSDDSHYMIGVKCTEEASEDMFGARHVAYAGIAKALAADYFCIYYVNTETDRFLEYSSDPEYSALDIEKNGRDFFGVSRRNAEHVIYSGDRERFMRVFTKENIMEALDRDGKFTFTYRLMFGSEPVYVRMKATRLEDTTGSHIVIGLSNVDAEITLQEKEITYSKIAQALAADYFSIYLVDADTGKFMEYSSTEEFGGFDFEKTGDDFFGISRVNIRRIMHPDDQEKFLEAFTKENILKSLDENKIFILTYRLLFDGVPTYAAMKITRLSEEESSRLIIGVNNIDAQMKREQKYASDLMSAREKANRDALTGVKSKHAYVEAEESINERIRNNIAEPFSIVVCDVNGLKEINDTKGHKEGDALICEACRMICRIFDHSPVYRIGGDEFVVITRGSDNEVIEALVAEAKDPADGRKGLLACGYSSFVPGTDACVSNVFERADEAMYEHKSLIKGVR